MQLGVWRSDGGEGRPLRLGAARLDFESRLRDWVASDPAIVEEGLQVLGTEVHLDSRRRVDVLAIDPLDRLVVVEIKANALTRDVVAQTLDYVARLQSMSRAELEAVLANPRHVASRALTAPDWVAPESALDPASREDVQGIAVGIGERADLTRVAEYLSAREVPIRHIAFDLFQAGDDLLLVRRIEPSAAQSEPEGRRMRSPSVSLETLFAHPALLPARQALVELVDVASSIGLHTRTYVHSVMFASAQNKSRMLFTISVTGTEARLYCAPDVFAEFYGTDPADVKAVVGAGIAGHPRVLDEPLVRALTEALPDWVADASGHTLRSAIEAVLRAHGPLALDALTEELNARELYARADGEPIPRDQVQARISKMLGLIIEDGIASLVEEI